MSATLILGRQGRIVIPVEIRAALGLDAGTELSVRAEGGRIVLERQADAAASLRGMTRGAAGGRSLVAELIAERREEASAG